MLNRKANFYAVMLILLSACTKQDITPVNNSAQSGSVDEAWWRPKPDPDPNPDPEPSGETVFGLLDEEETDDTKARMDEADLKLVRMQIYLSEKTVSKPINGFLEDGYDVHINMNWYAKPNGYRGFPTNTALLRSRAEEFFQYYAPYKDQIPFIAVENEWNFDVIHGGILQDYLAELAIITEIGHKYGFKITDGGITGNALQRWTYSQLSGAEQEQWKEEYPVNLNGGDVDYDYLMDMIDEFIDGVQDIDLDYINVHWYNARTCGDGFATATQAFMKACNQKRVVCNEFGIRSNSFDLYSATVDEIRGNADYAITYSGTNGQAVFLTDAMLDELY